MWLRVLGRSATGQAALDIGIDAIEIIETSQGLFAVTTTRAFGGLVSYRVTETGLSFQDSVIFHSGINRLAAPAIVFNQIDGLLQAGVMVNDINLVGYRIFESGSFGSRRWTELDQVMALADDPTAQRALALLGDTVLPATGAAGWQSGTIGFEHHAGGVLALGRHEPVLYSYATQPDGSLTLAATISPETGLWINAPTGLEVISAHGQAWAVVSAAGTHSLSVLQIGPDGSLQMVDHVIDTGQTRFANVQAITHAVVGDHVLIIAGGSDFGLTLFTLLPDGRLVWMQTLLDTALTGLDSISALQTVVVGGELLVLAGSARDAGVTSLTVPLAQLGGLFQGSPGQPGQITGSAQDDILIAAAAGDHLIGGAGHDILVAGPGHTILTGGAGADTFVMHPAMGLVEITDFERGLDRLDLSAWPMMRSPLQLQITPTQTGAVLGYQDAVVQITAADGAALGLWDLFPGGQFGGPDRMLRLDHLLPDLPAPPPAPPVPVLPVLVNRAGMVLGGIRLIARDPDSLEILGETLTNPDGSFTLPITGPAVIAVDHNLPVPNISATTTTDILRMAMGQSTSFANGAPLTLADFVAADINGDGRVGLRDALDALRISMGLRPPPGSILLPEALAQAPADITTPLPNGATVTDPGDPLILILRGDLDGSYL